MCISLRIHIWLFITDMVVYDTGTLQNTFPTVIFQLKKSSKVFFFFFFGSVKWQNLLMIVNDGVFPFIAEIIVDTLWYNQEHTVLQTLTSDDSFIYSVAVVPGLDAFHTVNPHSYHSN